MQVTFSPTYPFDHRGEFSKVVIPPCTMDSDLYLNCFTDSDLSYPYFKHYKPYGGSGTTTYKQYTNTIQSNYANIKDGMSILSEKSYRHSNISTSTEVSGIVYSAEDRRNILTTLNYNGGDDECLNYVGKVASSTDDLANYYPGATSTAVQGLIAKMYSAGNDMACASLHSPGDLRIKDGAGNLIGMVDGKEVNEFPLASFDKDKKKITILAATGEYEYVVNGTDDGTYGLDITLNNSGKRVKFTAGDIAMLPGQIHTYKINNKDIQDGKNGVTLSIDRDGDGIADRIISTGLNLSSEVYNDGATEEELASFAKGHKTETIKYSNNLPQEKLLYIPRYKVERAKTREIDPLLFEQNFYDVPLGEIIHE